MKFTCFFTSYFAKRFCLAISKPQFLCSAFLTSSNAWLRYCTKWNLSNTISAFEKYSLRPQMKVVEISMLINLILAESLPLRCNSVLNAPKVSASLPSTANRVSFEQQAKSPVGSSPSVLHNCSSLLYFDFVRCGTWNKIKLPVHRGFELFLSRKFVVHFILSS